MKNVSIISLTYQMENAILLTKRKPGIIKVLLNGSGRYEEHGIYLTIPCDTIIGQ